MDPVRGLIHLGLKVTETSLDRALDVIRLADTLLVASAVPPVREPSDESPWPDEEQADIDALSATLRARQPEEAAPTGTPTRPTRAAVKKSATKKAATTKRATKTAPAKKAPAKKATPTRAAAKKTAAKKAATPAAARKSTAKKAASTKATAKKSTAKATTPTLTVLPDA